MKTNFDATVVALLVALGSACSTTTADFDVLDPEKRSLEILLFESVSVKYGDALATDRKQYAQTHSVAERVEGLVTKWLRATGLMQGNYHLEIELDEFRLPGAGTRAMTAQFKGNDYLGSSATVLRADGSAIVSGTVRTQLGAMDRSIGENYSAQFALDNLIENLAWRIVFELTPPGYDDQVLELAKEEGVVPAIQELGWRGELSYGETLKYAATHRFRGNPKLAACAGSLAKPASMPAFIWDFPAIGLHGSCKRIAEQHRWRVKELMVSP